MIGFDFVKVYPIYPEAYEITWGLKGDGLPGIYKFSVYRSPNQRDWEELIKDVVNIHDYLDEEAPSSLKTFQVYYKIKVISPIGETAESSPVFLFEKPEKRSFLIAKEIIRRGNLLFRQFNGIKLAILKRKQYGEKCTDCFNPILDQVATSVCNCCYGTN
jgi:hypothetical protein